MKCAYQIWVSFLLVFLLFPGLNAQDPVIVIGNPEVEPDLRAAQVLQRYLGEMTGREVAILPYGEIPAKTNVVFIGGNPSLEKYGFHIPPSLPDDACFMEGRNGLFLLAGSGEMGAEYAAYDLLERLGCRKYSPRDTYIPKTPDLQLPELPPTTCIPAFPYRELWYEPAFDEEWARWHKLKTNPKKNEEWGLFVHTFHKLCPEEEYFAEHPEYFSWNGAQRSPGQLCLSNDTVRQIVVASLREMIEEKPEALYWSVSQNDNFDYCKCPRCAASDARHGGPAGTLLAFVNEVAAEFPDKIISTLAYQYTRRAPKGIRPAGNVSVCLCSIECNRGLPIAEGCTDFARDVAEWSQLNPNLMIWDYVVQFRSYVSPFPNWHTLQPNLQLFRDHGVRMLFEQGSGRDRSEFSDRRAYLLAKLMWDPQANADSILMDFDRGYFGEAGKYINAYVDKMAQNLAASDRWLGIYSTPQMEAHSFLTLEQILEEYLPFFDSARVVVSEEQHALHLMEAVLPLQYAILEHMKIRDDFYTPTFDPERGVRFQNPDAEAMLSEFIEALKQTGFLHLHERGYSADQYAADYRKYLEEGRVWHAFLQRETKAGVPVVSIDLAEPPSPNYSAGDPEILIDSRRGADDYHYNWLGFEGDDLDVTLRLPEEWPADELPEIRSVSIQFLQDQQAWVFFPEKVVIEISEDGDIFRQVHEETIDIVPGGEKAVMRVKATFEPVGVRAIRVQGVNQKVCPEWHSCVGNPCWIFVDEVVGW